MADGNGTRHVAVALERLPIKLILPKQGAEMPVTAGGGRPKPFRKVDKAYRERLHNQLGAIRQAIVPRMKWTGVLRSA